MEVTLELLALLSAAMFSGGALYISVVEHPARMRAGVAVAVAQFRQMYPRAAPWQASSAALCLLSGVLLALLTSAWVWGLGGIVVGLVIPFTLVGMMPINHGLLAPTAPHGDEAAQLLARWGRLHWVRSILGIFGFLVLLSRAVAR